MKTLMFIIFILMCSGCSNRHDVDDRTNLYDTNDYDEVYDEFTLIPVLTWKF